MWKVIWQGSFDSSSISEMSCKLTELLSYRKIWAAKSFWRSSCLTPHPNHIQLQQVVQDCLDEFWISPKMEMPMPVSIFWCPHSEKIFPKIGLEFLVLQSVSVASHPIPLHLWEEFAFSLSNHNIVMVNNESVPASLFLRLNKPNSFSCASFIHVLLDICFLRWLKHNLNSWIRCLNTSRRSLC